ncbi:hypothetical protein Tco_0956522 [Tanacetum coccineum]
MSDSKDSTVTYTAVSSLFGGLSDIRSLVVDGPPVMPEDPYTYVVTAFQALLSPDYVSGPKYPPLPEFVPELVYLEFMPPEDDVLPAEEDLKEEDDEDPMEDPADYPTDRDDDDEDEEEPSEYEADDKEKDEDDGGRSTQLRSTLLLAIPTLPSSPLSPWSSPLPQIPSPPLLVSPPPPTSPVYPLGYRAAMIRLKSDAPSTSHSLPLPPPIILSRTRSDAPPSGTPPILPIPLPTSSPCLLLPSTDHGADMPEVCLPPQKRICFAFGPRYEVGESSSAPATRSIKGFRADYGFITTLDREIRRDPEREVGYGIIDTWDDMLGDMPGVPAIDETELGWRMTNFVTTVRQDIDEIYREAKLSREAWGRSMDASYLARYEVMALHTQVVAQQSEIAALRVADCAWQVQHVETLRLMSTLQTQVTALHGQLGPVSGPAQPDISEEAGSSLKWHTKRTTKANPTNTTATTFVTNAQLKAMIDQGVTDALAARDVDRNTNGDNSHNSGTGVRRMERVARECTYPDFMKCQPLNFKGTEGVVELIQWFEKMETVFSISNCSMENQIKFSTCILLAGALTWWNSHVRTVCHDVAYAMTWTNLKKKMTDKYCPRVEIKKLEAELWNLKVKENKRKQDDNQQQQQQQNKRQNTGRAYTAGSGEKKPYGGSKPLSTTNANTANNQRGTRAGQKPTCYECGAQRHFKRDYPKLKNNNRGNQGRNGNAPAKVYAVGRVGTNPDSNVVMGTFLINNRYASVLFHTGADRRFVSTAFSS